MPANWAKFIPDLTQTLTSQKFTKPGGAKNAAGIGSYDRPEQKSEIGNPKNAILKSNQADYVNSFNTQPLSGRYDFGKQVAKHYIEAVKNMAQTHVAEFHINNPAAEKLLEEGYGIAFERLLKEGDIPLQDQFDEDGNLIEMGKESHPAYADFCPEVKEPTAEDLAKIEEENRKAFNKFTSENRSDYNLYKFKFYQFPCLTGNETQEELEVIFANRILLGYEFMNSGNARWDYFVWVCHLGSENYSGDYQNLNSQCIEDIEEAGYDYKKLADNVSAMCKAGILAAHPTQPIDGSQIGTNSALKKRIRRPATQPLAFPTIKNKDEKEVIPEICPINPYKIQVAHDFEEDSKRPKILTSNVVATFTWYPGMRDNIGFTGSDTPYVSNNQKALFQKDRIEYDKTKQWVKSKYENGEWKNHWRKTPPKGKLDAAARASDDNSFMGKKTPGAAFIALGWDGSGWGGSEAGTQYKYEYHRALCATKAAAKCEEEMTAVDHPWDPSGTTPDGKSYSGDPYMMMARVTIAYWYACIVKPFKPTPSAPPALISPPLTGIYIPIYYGSANRLANNLRRAWNTGKSFNKLPARTPPSQATAVAVAGAYALHLLEFKLLYLGGIPTPAGPVPMVGFVPIVF